MRIGVWICIAKHRVMSMHLRNIRRESSKTGTVSCAGCTGMVEHIGLDEDLQSLGVCKGE
jgi:hypothetical protein